MGIPTYRGAFGEEQAARLLWRAGFGPAPGQAAALAKLGLDGAVKSLTHPASTQLVGPDPHDADGNPLAPKDAWGHDHCWWLDRMVRTQAPLIERMTLVWHDWFATSKAGAPQKLMLRQNALLRRHALGNFEQLALDVTRDPAMLLWLNGTSNNRWDPNENYARELQELFCLGADRGYTERDVRHLARALTGFRNDWTTAARSASATTEVPRPGRQAHLRQAREVHLAGGRQARHPPSRAPASSWSRSCGRYFIPTAPPAATAKALSRLYVRGGRDVRPLLEAILRHPHLYDPARRMVKPPVVQVAGMLRAVGRGDRHDRLGLDLRGRRPVPVHAAERLRLGRHALAGHRHLPQPLADGAVHLRPGAARSRQGPPRPRTPPSWSTAPIAFWGSPGDLAHRARRPRALRRRHAGDRRRELEARRPGRSWRRTRCGCWSPPPPTT